MKKKEVYLAFRYSETLLFQQIWPRISPRLTECKI
jgi:hypothetical protein